MLATIKEPERKCANGAQPVDIHFEDVRLSVAHDGGKKRILKGVSGAFRSGELTAIVGPSGAGKSSLLNILTGFQTTGAKGTVRGRDCAKNNSNKESCYILQDDLLNPLFSVLETMTMAANLKLGDCMTAAEKQQLIAKIVENLGLSGTENTRCGRLSGGEKKRLSIALELIDNPSVMFLDEPTTGLDSAASLMTVAKLKELARAGRTIVCTVHQPSATIFYMFDHVYALAEGMCIYQGESARAVEYLSAAGLQCPKYHNPADYLLEVANCEYGDVNEELAKRSRDPRWRSAVTRDLVARDNVRVPPPTEATRFRVLVVRCFVQQYRDWTATHLKAIVHVLIGVTLGALFVGSGEDSTKTFSNFGFLLVSLIYITYTTMMPALLRFPQELQVLRKESFNNWYELETYYLAVVLCNAPVQLSLATLFASVAYSLSAQPPELWRFVLFLIVLMLFALIAEAIGHVIGTVVDKVNGTFFGAILTCSLLSFAGFLVQIPHMTKVMRAVSNLSYFRFGMEAIAQSVYGFNRTALACPEHKLYCHMKHPHKFLKELAMDGDYWKDISVLISLLFVVKAVAYLTLRIKVKRR